MTERQVTILVIGAHPDDGDFGAGGLAALCVRAGHRVHFVAVTNGDAGHFAEGGAPLARRRHAEARAAAAVLGLSYQILDNHDGELEPTLANRRAILRLIREVGPDVVITHRPYDYHPDHRYTAQLVQDAAFMVAVPGLAPLTPPCAGNPVFLFMADRFLHPYPLQPDVIVDIDGVLELKLEMLHQHTSQVYEWLAFNDGRLAEVPAGDAERRAWLYRRYEPRFAALADRYRERLREVYGAERGAGVRCAEAFEVCEYGAPLTPDNRGALFPFLP